MKEISKAILQVTKSIEGLEKDEVVGNGSNAYRGISEKMVKTSVKKLMVDNGLSIMPISITPNTQVSRWEETNSYGTKNKQSIFTEVTTKYLLLHTSGESIELAGYGHGVDTQDKGAGKATTYALKNTLMNTFMMITGEDTDNTHSQDIDIPKSKQDNNELPWFTDENLKNIQELIKEGNSMTWGQVRAKYRVAKRYNDDLNEILTK